MLSQCIVVEKAVWRACYYAQGQLVHVQCDALLSANNTMRNRKTAGARVPSSTTAAQVNGPLLSQDKYQLTSVDADECARMHVVYTAHLVLCSLACSHELGPLLQ